MASFHHEDGRLKKVPLRLQRKRSRKANEPTNEPKPVKTFGTFSPMRKFGGFKWYKLRKD